MRNDLVVVAGTSSGIGSAILFDLSDHGLRVVGVARSARSANLASDVAWVSRDVSDADTVSRAAATAENLGCVIGASGNAGVIESVPLHLISDERIDGTLDTNLRGTIIGMRAALRTFLRRGTSGSIVDVGSIHADIA